MILVHAEAVRSIKNAAVPASQRTIDFHKGQKTAAKLPDIISWSFLTAD